MCSLVVEIVPDSICISLKQNQHSLTQIDTQMLSTHIHRQTNVLFMCVIVCVCVRLCVSMSVFCVCVCVADENLSLFFFSFSISYLSLLYPCSLALNPPPIPYPHSLLCSARYKKYWPLSKTKFFSSM